MNYAHIKDTKLGGNHIAKEGGYRQGSKSRPTIVQNVKARPIASTARRLPTSQGHYKSQTEVEKVVTSEQRPDHTDNRATLDRRDI